MSSAHPDPALVAEAGELHGAVRATRRVCGEQEEEVKWDGRIRADARQLPIASESVQCVVTSPPYWGLRDYGNSDQIGLEATPREYVASMREVALELWRVLKPDGVLWLNLGDTFAGSWGAMSYAKGSIAARRFGGDGENIARPVNSRLSAGLKSKDLIGIPWRVAFALQEDGWWLRSDIIWAKKNCMPESVTDRPTRSHEYIFLLTKSERYFYDAAAIREPSVYGAPNSPDKIKSPHAQNLAKMDKQRGHSRRHDGFNDRCDSMTKEEQYSLGRNKRDVWSIGTHAYPEAHYATFPEEIPEICIKAGTRPGDMVLDPFFGSGTVGRVAERLNRRWIGIDLGYQELQKKRVANVQKELLV